MPLEPPKKQINVVEAVSPSKETLHTPQDAVHQTRHDHILAALQVGQDGCRAFDVPSCIFHISDEQLHIGYQQTDFGYEVSPSPKDANLIRCRQPGRSLVLRRAFQKAWLFGGRSPWPVVEMAIRTTSCCSNCFCKNINGRSCYSHRPDVLG